MLARLPTRTRDDASDLRRVVVAVAGDMAQPGLGLAAQSAAALAAGVDIVLHCAASIAFDAPMHTLLATNYEVRRLRQLGLPTMLTLRMPTCCQSSDVRAVFCALVKRISLSAPVMSHYQ